MSATSAQSTALRPARAHPGVRGRHRADIQGLPTVTLADCASSWRGWPSPRSSANTMASALTPQRRAGAMGYTAPASRITGIILRGFSLNLLQR